MQFPTSLSAWHDRITEKKKASFAASSSRQGSHSYAVIQQTKEKVVQSTRAAARNLAGDTGRVLRASTKHFYALYHKLIWQSLSVQVSQWSNIPSEGIIIIQVASKLVSN
jgi:hypothetical protein